MDAENKSLRRATRIYEALLWLYPQPYRREYGPMMSQLFAINVATSAALGIRALRAFGSGRSPTCSAPLSANNSPNKPNV